MEQAARPALQGKGGVLSRQIRPLPALSLSRNPAAPPKPGPPPPGAGSSSTALCCLHTWPRSAWPRSASPSSWTPRRLLTWSLPGPGGPADLASQQGRRLKFQEAGPRSQSGHCPRVTHRSGPLSGRPPAYLWDWQVGAGPARRPHSLCLSKPRPPRPHLASERRINGPAPWPGSLALVLCGLWPQAPWACARLRTAL